MGSAITTVATIAVKTAVNFVIPGASAVIDFGKAACNFYKGNIADGFSNTVTGVCDLVSFGAFPKIKTTAQEVWKQGFKKTFANSITSISTNLVKVWKQELKPMVLLRSLGMKLKDGLVSKINYVRNACAKPEEMNKILLKDGLRGIVESGGRDVVNTAANKMRSSAVSHILTEKTIQHRSIELTTQWVTNEIKKPANIKTVAQGVINFVKDAPDYKCKILVNGSARCEYCYPELGNMTLIKRCNCN